VAALKTNGSEQVRVTVSMIASNYIIHFLYLTLSRLFTSQKLRGYL